IFLQKPSHLPGANFAAEASVRDPQSEVGIRLRPPVGTQRWLQFNAAIANGVATNVAICGWLHVREIWRSGFTKDRKRCNQMAGRATFIANDGNTSSLLVEKNRLVEALDI